MDVDSVDEPSVPLKARSSENRRVEVTTAATRIDVKLKVALSSPSLRNLGGIAGRQMARQRSKGPQDPKVAGYCELARPDKTTTALHPTDSTKVNWSIHNCVLRESRDFI